MSQQIKDLEVVGKDVVGSELPAVITAQNTEQEFAAGTTWGRVLRLRRIDDSVFFDLGLDRAGNLFINTTSDTATKHVLTINAAGGVTIVGDLTVTGKLVAGE